MQKIIWTSLIIVLFYIIGRLIYPKKDGKHFRFLKVLATFVVTQFTNAIILGFMISIATTMLVIFSNFLYNNQLYLSDIPIFSHNDKVQSGNILLIILVFILITSILQFKFRGFFLRKFPILRLDIEEYEIFEYFIQWMAIYLVIYQFLFEGLKELIKTLSDAKTVNNIFSVILSPDNINIIMQPLIIATWIVIVMEKIKLRECLKADA